MSLKREIFEQPEAIARLLELQEDTVNRVADRIQFGVGALGCELGRPVHHGVRAECFVIVPEK